MFKKFLASLGALALGLGLAVTTAVPATADPIPGPNQPAYWDSDGDGPEVCIDGDHETEDSASDPYVLPAPPADSVWSKVIIKAGSETDATIPLIEGSYLYTTDMDGGSLTQGDEFTHPTKGSISHVIVCYIPAPEPDPEKVSGDATVTPQVCDQTTWTKGGGSISPVATSGVSYKLYADNGGVPGTLLADPFSATYPAPPGIYHVEVIDADPNDLFEVVGEKWLQREVLDQAGKCAPDEPKAVSGTASGVDQTCPARTLTLVAGSVTVGFDAEGVTYELYADDNGAPGAFILAFTSASSGDLAPGDYWVKVLPASGAYSVSEEKTWIPVAVLAFEGECSNVVKAVGDPFDVQECIEDQIPALTSFELTSAEFAAASSSWTASLTIVAGDPAAAVQYRVLVDSGSGFVDQGIWVPGVYYPGVDFPFGSTVKVVAEAVTPYVLQDPKEWSFFFAEPFDCDLPEFGVVEPSVEFEHTCEAGASYTLSVEGGDASTVLWSINGSSPEAKTLGTYVVSVPSTVEIVATPAPGSGFPGEVAERSFEEEFDEIVCDDLTTLALTGTGPTVTYLGIIGLLAIAGGLLTAARARREVSRA